MYKRQQVQLIDFHAPLYPYPFMLPDAVHPDKEGAAVLAKTVYEGITGDFGGLQIDVYKRQGIDNGRYPTPRTVLFGLQLSF